MKRLIFVLGIVTLFTLRVNASTPPLDTSIVSIGNVSKTAILKLVDQKTGVDIAAIFSNVVIQNNNPEFATVSAGSSSTSVIVSPVASGTGTAIISCHVLYTDLGDGLNKSEDKQIVLSYTITYTPPDGSKLKLTFN